MIFFKEFMDTKPSLLQIKAEIQHYDAIEQEIDDIKPIIAVGTTALSTGKVAIMCPWPQSHKL